MGKIVSKTKASYALAKKSPRDLSKVFDYSQQGKNWDKYCQIGDHQSPIKFPKASDFKINPKLEIKTKYNKLNDVELENNGNTLMLTSDKIGTLELHGVEEKALIYKGAQFHFHHPAEHIFEGKAHHPMELHIVHSLVDGPTDYKNKYAVIAIYFKYSDKENQFLKSLEIKTLENCKEVDLPALLDSIDHKDIYYYEGSLTTPPCTEAVNWLSLNEVQNATEEQINRMKGHWERFTKHQNYRACCSINDRTLYKKE